MKTEAKMQISQDLLKKYIMYSKRFVHPKLNEIDREKVTQFYADIRRQSSVVGGIPIAVRHIESVLRMSEAYAKVHLRDYVRIEDIDFAIQMLLKSFLQSQKESIQRVLLKNFDKYLNHNSEVNMSLKMIIDKMARTQAIRHKMNNSIEEEEKVSFSISVKAFQQEASEFKISSIDDFLKSSLFRKKYQLSDGLIKGSLIL